MARRAGARAIPGPPPGAPAAIEPKPVVALAVLLLLSVLLHLGLALLEGPLWTPSERPLSGDEKRYVEVAGAWAAGEPAELDPLWPPGYPATIALVLRCGGTLSWIVGLQVVALFVAGLALGRITLEVGASPPVAALAAALLVVDPEVGVYARLYRPEALHLALLSVALALAIRATRAQENRVRPLQLVLLGTLVGLAIALKSLLLPLVPLFLLAVMFVPRAAEEPVPGASRWRPRWIRGLLVGLPLLAVLSPVLLFEHARNGVWTLGGSARFNLWVGLTDRSARSLAEDRTWEEYLRYRAGGATFAERQSAITQRLRDLVQARGLPALVAGQFPRQYFRLFDRESYFSAALPPGGSRFLAGEGYRDAPPLLARLFGAAEVGIYTVLLLMAPFGLVRLVRERRPGASWVTALLAYQLALFWFVHVKSRYRLTLLPLLALGVAWTIETVRRRGREGALPVSIADLALGAAGAALSLYFAFGAD
ncbi:MAG: glycosyltransferase family 39 protein [Thermoanaerobaculia bacterium]